MAAGNLLGIFLVLGVSHNATQKQMTLTLIGDETQTGGDTNVAFKPYDVKVTISNLNIRVRPGTNYSRTQYTGIGVFTIVEESDGEGATKWGKLGNGKGWISLDYTTKI